jgi:hypothetical protein
VRGKNNLVRAVALSAVKAGLIVFFSLWATNHASSAGLGPVVLGQCDLVLHWDDRTLSSCVKELQQKLEANGIEIHILQSENKILRNHVCLMAQELQSKNASETYALVIEDTCAELRARAKKKSAK